MLDKMKGDVIIFGYGDVGLAVADYVRNNCENMHIHFCDNSTLKQQTGGEDYQILSVESAVASYKKAMFIIASLYHSKQMKEQLVGLGVSPKQIVSELPEDVVNSCRQKEISRRKSRRENLRFEVNINKHCNLNCKGCDHFAPLSDVDCMDLNVYTKDMQRMSVLFNGEAYQIHLLGGEPLLNPDLLQYIKVARECFATAEICLDTNGVLLDRMNDEFWEVCKFCKITILPTRYPIKLDYDALEALVRSHGIGYRYLGSSESGRTLWHFPLDLEGKQIPTEMFLQCRNANECLTLENGRLYTCSIAPNVTIFNRYYNQKIELTEMDGVDIYKVNSGDEVLEAMAKPMPFCRYCDVNNRTYDHPWEVSRKDIKEWT